MQVRSHKREGVGEEEEEVKEIYLVYMMTANYTENK